MSTMTDHDIERVIVSLMNLRASIAVNLTSIQDPAEMRGGDAALTMAIEDWKCLLTPPPTCAILDAAQECAESAR